MGRKGERERMKEARRTEGGGRQAGRREAGGQAGGR